MGLHIEIKQILSVAGVITNLRQSRLDIENLDQLILIINNWLSDTHVVMDL